MAKLSAHGRTELIRLEKREPYTDTCSGLPNPDPKYWVRTTFVVMSDGVVLRKTDWCFPCAGNPNRTDKHGTGWKAIRKLKAEVLPTIGTSNSITNLINKGYTIVK